LVVKGNRLRSRCS